MLANERSIDATQMSTLDNHSYSRAWTRYLRSRTLSVVMLLGFFPWMMIIGNAMYRRWGFNAVMAVFIPWGLGWALATGKAKSFACPRCGDEFFGPSNRPQWAMFLIRTCRSCGLPKYQEGAELQVDEGVLAPVARCPA